jgi:hypothetical protein
MIVSPSFCYVDVDSPSSRQSFSIRRCLVRILELQYRILRESAAVIIIVNRFLSARISYGTGFFLNSYWTRPYLFQLLCVEFSDIILFKCPRHAFYMFVNCLFVVSLLSLLEVVCILLKNIALILKILCIKSRPS